MSKLPRIWSLVALLIASPAAADLLVAVQSKPFGGVTKPAVVFDFQGTGALGQIGTIPAKEFNDPGWALATPDDELLIDNRGDSTIGRFRIAADGSYTRTGTIRADANNGLNQPQRMALSPSGELFIMNFANDVVSRLLVTANGATANGTIHTGNANGGLGVVVAPWGELFTSGRVSPKVLRFQIDSTTGVATANGSLTIPGATEPHGMAFSGAGELFVAEPYESKVFRYTFDVAHTATLNGSITVAGGSIDVAFSKGGELFVSSHNAGQIARFTFDGSGNAVPGAVVATDQLVGIAILEPSTATDGGAPKDGAADGPPAASQGAGCACRAIPARGRGNPPTLFFAVAAAALFRRTRRRPPRTSRSPGR